MSAVIGLPIPLSISVLDDALTCTFANTETEHPFGVAERDALLIAVATGERAASVALATSLSLLSHLFSLVRNCLHRSVSQGIPVTLPRERFVYADPIVAVCAALLLLIDPLRETGHAALVAFVLGHAPPTAFAMQDRSQLPIVLADAAVCMYLRALRVAAAFRPPMTVLHGWIAVPQHRHRSLAWLSRHPDIYDVLRHMMETRIVAFHELVAIVIAIFGDSDAAAGSAGSAAGAAGAAADDFVSTAMDAARGVPCAQEDTVRAMTEWISRAPFPPTVSQLEIDRVLRLEPAALATWVGGPAPPPVAPAAAPPQAAFRFSGFLLTDEARKKWDQKTKSMDDFI
jgi:hypothetical protein